MNSTIQSMKCPICSFQMRQSSSAYLGWLMVCPNCKFESSNLSAGVGSEVIGIESLRIRNFNTILDIIEECLDLTSIRALEVGCNRGLFLDAARIRGLDCIGIEPEVTSAMEARSRGHTVYNELFPDTLDADRFQNFDLIIFNDVFEHLPDVRTAKVAIHQLLTPRGLLVLNLPNSNGILYRLAKVFARVGWRQPLERLWQKGLASPHLSYFNPENIEMLFVSDGRFSLVDAQRLDSLQISGLWQRLRSGGQSRLTSLLLYIPLTVTALFARVLPADIQLLVFRKIPHG